MGIIRAKNWISKITTGGESTNKGYTEETMT